jgi:hypothetical protein
MRWSLRMPRVDHRVVVNHDNPVPGCVNIELDRVGTQLYRTLERRERVLRVCLVSAPMGDSFGRIAVSAVGQVALGAVALC